MMLSASLWRMTSTPTWQNEIEANETQRPRLLPKAGEPARFFNSVLLLLTGKLVVLIEGQVVRAVRAQHVLSFVAIPICLNFVAHIHATAQLR